MKKVLSSLLVLALLLGSCSAFADTVSWSTGSGFKTDLSTFKIYFNVFSAATDYTFNWNSSTKTENGYTVYTAKSSDSLYTMKVYVKNNKIHMVYGEANTSITSDAEKLGEWIGASMLCSLFSLYYCEHNDISESTITKTTEEFVSFFSKYASTVSSFTESQYKNGIVLTQKFCGYPCALELKFSGTSVYTFKGTIKMFIVPSSGKITVK